MVRSSFPRGQQYRRLRRAAGTSAAATAAGALAMISLGAGATALAGALVLVMIGLVIDARDGCASRAAVASALVPRIGSRALAG